MPSLEFEQFLKSTKIDYIQWHDGVGYDLETLCALKADERLQIEDLLVANATRDWRDIEALDSLGSDRALAAIKGALSSDNYHVRIGAAKKLANRHLLSESQIESIIVNTLPSATILNGMVVTLDFALAHPSLAVCRKLLWCTLNGNDDIRVHAAALVHFLYGRSSERFDMKHRPFYLRFKSKNTVERNQAYVELCKDIGVKPE
jgi:hypothetical protein